MSDYSRIPEHMRSGARLYIEQGISPGGFLMAVLCNNLVDAFGRADTINRQELFAWTAWLMWDIPANAWGSAEKVDAYIQAKFEESKDVTIN